MIIPDRTEDQLQPEAAAVGLDQLFMLPSKHGALGSCRWTVIIIDGRHHHDHSNTRTPIRGRGRTDLLLSSATCNASKPFVTATISRGSAWDRIGPA